MRLSDRTLTIVAVLWIVAVNLFAANPTDMEYEFPGPTILLCAAVQVFPMGLICGIISRGFDTSAGGAICLPA
jgi:exopolysaccharide production protein ExoZ